MNILTFTVFGELFKISHIIYIYIYKMYITGVWVSMVATEL